VSVVKSTLNLFLQNVSDELINFYSYISVHGRNDFAEILKNLARSENNFVFKCILDHQNNYMGNSRMMSDAAKKF